MHQAEFHLIKSPRQIQEEDLKFLHNGFSKIMIPSKMFFIKIIITPNKYLYKIIFIETDDTEGVKSESGVKMIP